MAAVLPFCFFIAYGVMSIPPAGLPGRTLGARKKTDDCRVFSPEPWGALSFAVFPFVSCGDDLAVHHGGRGWRRCRSPSTHCSGSPGGAANFAFNSAFCASSCSGRPSFVSPLVYSYLVTRLGGQSTRQPALPASAGRRDAGQHAVGVDLLAVRGRRPWLMAAFIAMVKVPAVKRTADESGRYACHVRVIAAPIEVPWLYFPRRHRLRGSEQGNGPIGCRSFLAHYHGFDPHVTGASAVSYFWGLLTIGCPLSAWCC